MTYDCRCRELSEYKVVALLISLLIPTSATWAESGDATWFYLRNYNPFLQVHGIVPFQPAGLIAEGENAFLVNLEIANNADSDEEPDEIVILDGESYFLTLAYRYGVASWLELGLDLPFVAHTGGSLDPLIKSWHSILGISNTKRNGPTNEIHFQYSGAAASDIDLRDSASGIRDVLLSAALPLRRDSATGRANLALRMTAKLATGEKAELLGSGAADYAIGLHGDRSIPLRSKTLDVTGFVGMMTLGDGGVLAEIKRDQVAFAGGGASWQVTRRLSAVAQLHYQQSYYDTDLEELGGKTLQLSVGGVYHPEKWPVTLTFGVIEDIFGDATPDVVLHAGIRWSAAPARE